MSASGYKQQLPPSSSSGPTHIDVLSRDDFLDYFGSQYAPGQHVTFIGPTQRGKTTLSHQMMGRVLTPDGINAVLLAGKPPGRDPVMARAAEELNLRTVEEWPPPKGPIAYYRDKTQRNGYVLRPRHGMEDVRADNANIAKHFRAAMVDCYRSKPDHPVIIGVDEAHLVQNEYKLRSELEAPLMRGAPVCAVWCLIQRGRYVTYLAYDAPAWIIIYNDPDRDNQKRYSEIGGVDPSFVLSVVSGLKTYTGSDGKSTISEALCIRRAGPELFIVDVK